MPSGELDGHEQANIVDVINANPPAAIKILAGGVAQNQFSPVRHEKSVKKSDIDTFKYIDAVT
jgi:hypothetical protein